MKLRTLASAAALSLLAAPAYAVSDTIAISGNQVFTCVINNNEGPAGATVDLGALDGGDGTGILKTSVTASSTAWKDSYCNGNHKITLTSAKGGLTSATALPAGSDAFDSHVNYTATVAEADWGVSTGGLVLTTAGAAGVSASENINNAFRNDGVTGNTLDSTGLKVTVTFAANGVNPLLQSPYTDTLTLELAAQ